MSSLTQATQEPKTPSATVMMHAAKISIVQDRPIMMDYWTDALEGHSFVGVKTSGEKMLVKNESEYTSPIAKIFKVENEYIISTENSLYVVPATILSKRIKD